MLNIVFAGSTEAYKQNVARCFKVHIDIEQQKPKPNSSIRDGWIQPKATTLMNKSAKVVSFWCFSPNFGYVFEDFVYFGVLDCFMTDAFSGCNNY